jgi:hypothetical protein
MEEIINLSLFEWGKYEMVRPWLIKLIKIRSLQKDYALIAHGEAQRGDNVRLENISVGQKSFLRRSSPIKEGGEGDRFRG